MKDYNYVNINSVNPLCLIIGEVDGCIEEKNGNKYLTLIFTDKNKKVLIQNTELWDKIKNLIKNVNDKPGDFDEKYMRIKFDSL